MKGTHRYVKPIKRTTAPGRVLCVVPETSFLMNAIDGGEYYYNAQWVWYTDSRRYGTKWTGGLEPKRMHPDDWWRYVKDTVKCGTRLFIVAPNAGDFCTVTGFWRWVDDGSFDFGDISSGDGSSCPVHRSISRAWRGRLVLGGPPDIIHCTNGKGTVCIVSLRNYTESSWEKLESAVSGSDVRRSDMQADRFVETFDVSDRCSISTGYMRQLISGWVERDCGPWKDTVAQLSVSYWKRRFYTQKVCRHDNAQAIELERSAAFGGRNEVWYYGDVGEKASIPDGADPCPKESGYPTLHDSIYRCDVSAQYPALLRDKEFPIRLVGVRDSTSVADLEALTRYWGVIANVRLWTDRPEYPCKRSGETAYPVGRYDTTLAGPELVHAIRDGEVKTCHSLAYYELGNPLRDYAKHLIELRERSTEDKDSCGESFAKCLATAIGGKFSQRTRRREPCPEVVNPFGRWGPFTRIGPDGQPVYYVSIAGVSYTEVESASGGKLLAALYCYLTSYGRCQMREIREAIYPCVPYSQCTDGIWVGDKALATLQRHGLSACRTAGRLRMVSPHSYARWITPSHYYVDGKWTLSGYRHGAVIGSDLVATEYRDKNPVRTCPFKAPMAIKRECIKRKVLASRLNGKIGPDGWLVTPNLEE